MARNPFVGSGRAIEGGALATRKQDFNAHVDGTGFRQLANTVDIQTIEGVAANTVQEALETLNNLITSAGSGFISIGKADGYAQGSYTVGSEGYDSLRDAFEGAIADPRLENGGVILVLAGTYTTSATITIPAGITVMGEMGGTIIVGEMPDVPMFQVSSQTSRIYINGDAGGGAPFASDNSGKIEGVTFFNLTLIDNLDGYAAFGGTSMQSVPMVRCAVNTHVTFDQCRFIGRLNDDNTYATYAAVGYSSGSSSGTHLHFNKCFFDGITVPIWFTPGGGSVDSLSLNACRARVLSRDVGNGFCHFTQCHAKFTNNQVYELSAIGPLEYCFVLTETYADDESIIIATGNSGKTSYNTAKVVDSNTALSYPYNCIMAGNSWGQSQGTGWYVIAGLDYVGETALDTIINSSIDLEETDVYVIGTYVCTTTGSTALRLHGGHIKLDLTSGTDTGISSHRRFQVKSIDNVTFECDSALTTTNHTVVIENDFNNDSFVYVNNCEFINCGLRVNRVDTLTAGESSNVTVANCNFYSASPFGGYCLLLPSAHSTVVENCTFTNVEYMGGIGEVGTYTHAVTRPNITIRNCTMVGGTITNSSPISSGIEAYFWIDDTAAKVTIENCRIIPGDAQSSLMTSGAFRQAIYIRAADVSINECIVSDNEDVVTISAVQYIMPTFFIEPSSGVRVNGCKFSSCGFPLQIGGSTAFTSGAASGAVITNNEFMAGGTDYGFTQLDFDIDLNAIPTYRSRIVVENNIFNVNPVDGTYYPVYHSEATGSFYNTLSVVQIHANLFDVFVANNHIKAVAYEPPSQFTEVAGLVINNTDSNLQSGQIITKTFLNNNYILVETDYSAAMGMDPLSVQSAWIETPCLHMTNNHLSCYLSAALSDVLIRCLYLDNSPVQGHSEGLITGNVFSSKNETGNTGYLNDEYIYITNTSGAGQIVNNSFATAIASVVSGGTEEVDDNTTGTDKWIIHSNKNQVQTLTVNAGMGAKSLIDQASVSPVSLTTLLLLAGRQTSVSSVCYASNSTDALTMYYADQTDTIQFDWVLPARDILPPGVRITRIRCTHDPNVVPDTTASFSLSIRSVDGGTADSTSWSISSTSAVQRTLTPASEHYNTPANNVVIRLSLDINDANSDVIVEFNTFEITYTW